MQSNLSRTLFRSIKDGTLEEKTEELIGNSINNYEYLCLQGVAAGESRYELSTQLGVSELLVEMYLENCAKKLNAKNVTHAVAIAFRSNILN